jgi:hypothetical protein
MLPYQKLYYLTHPHTFFLHLYRAVRSFIQRGIRGFSNEDIWSLDMHLCSLISGSVKRLANTCYSHPCDMEGNNSEEKTAMWKDELMTIANGFDAGASMADDPPMKKLHNGQEVIDLAAYEEKEKQFRKGMDLFAKRFFNLWD